MNGLGGKRVLVTGAGGFIGSHLAQLLVEQGAHVRALVKYNGRGDLGKLSELSPEVLGEIDVRLGDIRDPFFVRQCAEECDVVLHLAALIGIPYSYVAPADYVQTNVVGTLNVLEACREHEVDRLVQTSTSEVYGSATSIPMPETHRLHPQSPYAASKVSSDALALSYHRSFELPVTILRPFNTYGPRQSLRAVLPTIVSQILYGKRRVRLGAVNPERDLTFVEDTARGFIAAATSDATLGDTFNLGFGQTISIGELALLAMKVIGKKAAIVVSDDRMRPEASEVDCLQADASRFHEATGWKPEISLRDGIARVAEYLNEFPPANVKDYAV